VPIRLRPRSSPQAPWHASPPRRETRASATTTPGNRTVRHPGRYVIHR